MPLDTKMIEVLDPKSPNGYRLTLERLQEVCEEDLDEDLKPSQSALDRATWLVQSVVVDEETFPLAWVCPEGNAGLRLTWTSNDRKAKIYVIVPSSEAEEFRLIYIASATEEPLTRRFTSPKDLAYFLPKLA